MTGAVATADPAAAAAGNATILSGQTGNPPALGPSSAWPIDPNPPPQTTPPTEPPKEPEPGPETEPTEEGEEGKEPSGAPEQYSFEAPPGVTLDPAAVEAFAPVAKDLGLTQAQAQRVVDLYAGLQARQAQAQAEQVRQWAGEVKADPEIGGAKWSETQALVARARDRFASPELLELMNSTGLGNHRAVIKHFAQIGREIADDGHVIGGQPGPEPRTAENFYARMAR